MAKGRDDQDVVVVDIPEEVGDEATIETPYVKTRATWLGVVENGHDLAAAMQLMAEMEAERVETA